MNTTSTTCTSCGCNVITDGPPPPRPGIEPGEPFFCDRCWDRVIKAGPRFPPPHGVYIRTAVGQHIPVEIRYAGQERGIDVWITDAIVCSDDRPGVDAWRPHHSVLRFTQAHPHCVRAIHHPDDVTGDPFWDIVNEPTSNEWET